MLQLNLNSINTALVRDYSAFVIFSQCNIQISFLFSILSTWYLELSDPFSWLPQILMQLWLTPATLVRSDSSKQHRCDSVSSEQLRFDSTQHCSDESRYFHFVVPYEFYFFLHQITKKLNDKNFLLWRQQIKSAITMRGLNRFVVNPQIPPQYVFDEDCDLDRVNPLFSMW